ncbi:MAG TPA: hypothetical protein VHX60_15000 [Acidobacteriaceae bacterium]|jgi:hypothetical protein|nr:hypothetical protein [Acidobacteriaceae bacterium]
MDSSHVKVAAFSLLSGVVLTTAIALTVGMRVIFRLAQSGGGKAGAPPTTTPVNPNDSPVTVRGGSFESLSQTSWDSKGNNGYSTSPVDLSVLVVEGNLNGISPVVNSQTGITTNWQIVMTFRGPDDAPNDGHDALMLCTKPGATTKTCEVGTPFIKGQNTLFLMANGKGPGAFTADLSVAMKNDLDTYSLLRYDVPECGATGPVRETRCNHLSSIAVTGTTSIDGTYTCQAGGCEIGIGPPNIIAPEVSLTGKHR